MEVVLRRTDGNPFFVLELARLLATQGPVDARAAEDVEVPEGVADVLRLRVLGLSAPARAVLEAASVRGREIDPSAVSVLDVDGPGPVLDALDEAAVAGLVQPGPTAGGFRFVHALTRETVYDDLPPGRRARLHAEVGGVLADRLAGRPDLVTEVAHHHARAAAYLPELCVPAVRFGVLAAESAERRGAFDEALSLWTRTYELERRDPVPDRLRRHSLLLRLATARQRTGDMAGAQSALEEARGLARAAGDFVAVAEAVTSFRSGGIWHWREMGAEDPATVAALRECLEHVEDPGLQARLWANLGLEHYVAWRGEEAEECGRRALRIARAQPDLEVLRDCLSARAVALWTPGSSAALEGCARELLGLPLSEEHRIAAHFHLAMALHHQGRGVEAETEMAEALAVARRIRHSAGDVPLAWWRWLRAQRDGRPLRPRARPGGAGGPPPDDGGGAHRAHGPGQHLVRAQGRAGPRGRDGLGRAAPLPAVRRGGRRGPGPLR